MRARWEALHAALDRSVRSLQAEQAFQQARQHPALARFDQPFEVVEYLASKGGDLDEKDRLLGVLVTLVQRREHHELVSGLLWLGLWPGLDAVYRRRQRNFRGQPEELIAELADVFTGIIERLDLEVVHRVAATLVRSTARDLIDRRRRRRMHRHHPLLVPLAGDPHRAGGELNIRQVEPRQLRDTDSGRVQQLEHGTIAQIGGLVVVGSQGRCQELTDLLGGQHVRQGGSALGGVQPCPRIRRQQPLLVRPRGEGTGCGDSS